MTTPANFEVQYTRDTGVHNYEALDGTRVTSVATSDWETFVESVDGLPQASGYIISPELITAPYEIADITNHHSEINARLNTGRELSQSHPDALLLVGTPTVDEGAIIRNSLAVIRDGIIEGYIDKRGVMSPEEMKLFSRHRRPQAELKVGHSALVCSDILISSFELPGQTRRKSEILQQGTMTVLVSSCWAVPLMPGIYTPLSPEERFKSALELTITRLFDTRPQLREVIMTDRATSDSDTRPFNAHFVRSTELTEIAA